MTLLILISGKRFSGKTTYANIVSRGLECPVLGLADMVKEEYALDICGSPADAKAMLWHMGRDREFKESHRRGLIDLGMLRRDMDKDYWCRVLEHKIQDINPKYAVIGDIRFANELAYFSSKFRCISVRMNTSLTAKEVRGMRYNSEIDTLEIETGLDSYSNFSMVVDNNHDGDFTGADRIIELARRMGSA